MKIRLLVTVYLTAILVMFCTPESELDPCKIDKIGFLIIINGSTGTDAINMDIFINSLYETTLLPQSSTNLIELKEGEYIIEGRAIDGSRIWLKKVNILECLEENITLGS